ncbi:hypothetical protein NC651_030336 [Populus alba x Populus x berolinensis]|nr:hypothetical protein NC651_030336 [Populus alba x Populus x berolinensis]
MTFEQFHGASFLLQKIVAMDGLVSTIWCLIKMQQRFITILVSSSNSAVV